MLMKYRYGELDDVHITLKTSILVAQELGVEAFDEPYYHSLEERLTTRSACAQSYHFIFKMMVQCILHHYIPTQYSSRGLITTHRLYIIPISSPIQFERHRMGGNFCDGSIRNRQYQIDREVNYLVIVRFVGWSLRHAIFDPYGYKKRGPCYRLW